MDNAAGKRQKQGAGKVACGVYDGDGDKEKWKRFHSERLYWMVVVEVGAGAREHMRGKQTTLQQQIQQ